MIQESSTILSLPVAVFVALITAIVTITGVLLTQVFLFPKQRAETKVQLRESDKKTIEMLKLEAETESLEIINEEKRNLLSNNQISTLLETALKQSKQIDELLKESSAQKIEINRLFKIVGIAENEKSELNAVIKYQQGELERIQKNWAETLTKLNESRQRENALSDKLEISIRQTTRLQNLLSENGVIFTPLSNHTVAEVPFSNITEIEPD